jgi:hypothetical protein
MRVLRLTIVAALSVIVTAAAADPRFERSLRLLAPTERLEQLCDYTAMTQIRKDKRQLRPDRAVANAMSDVQHKSDMLVAKGAAVRSRGKWYALSYTCSADAEHLKVTSFTYKLGAEIPEGKWAGYGLWQ